MCPGMYEARKDSDEDEDVPWNIRMCVATMDSSDVMRPGI